MTTLIKTSCAGTLGEARNIIWRTLYNFKHVNLLANSLKEYLNDYNIDIEFDFNTVSITVISNNGRSLVSDASILKDALKISFIKALNELLNDNEINITEYDTCIKNIDNLYFVTFTSLKSNTAIVKL